MNCISAKTVANPPYMVAARALSPPSNASTSFGRTGTMIPSASMSSATVMKMKASVALRTGAGYSARRRRIASERSVAEPAHALFVESEEVRDLVHDRPFDLVADRLQALELVKDGRAEDRDAVGWMAREVVRPVGQRRPFVEAEKRVPLGIEPDRFELLVRGPLLDADRDVLQVARELGGDRGQRLGHQLLEARPSHAAPEAGHGGSLPHDGPARG